MTNQRTLARTTLLAALLGFAGLPASAAQAAPKAAANASAQESSSIAQSLEIARSALVLQEGDLELMSKALERPVEFQALANAREFNGELIVHAQDQAATKALARVSPLVGKSSQMVNEYVISVPQGMTESELATMLMATGDYKFVEPNWTLFPMVIPNDSQYGSSWQHTRLQSAAAWDIHTGTDDIIVAVCDSGVDTNHPDLQDALIPGYNAVNNDAQIDGGLVEDVNGHGSFVSGLAAAQGNNGRGVVGVGWDFRIMPIRVSNNSAGTASAFDLLEGSRWAVDNGARIVNVSFSGGSSSGNQATAKYVIDRGGMLFWASGNDNSFVGYDAPDLVLVGSTTSSDNRSGFSNFGTAVDLTAPGSGVRSTNRNGGYNNSSGTSYASPIAAGVGAMIFSVRPELTGQDAQDVLYRSVDDLGAPGRDDFFGRGRVNTLNALQLALTYEQRLPLPLIESFESSSWMDSLEVTAGSVSTITDAESPGSGSVLLLDQTDQVTTVPMGGRTLPTGLPLLSYDFKASGVEAGETLDIEMLTEDQDWVSLLNYVSTGVDTNGYVSVGLVVPIEFLWHGVQIRMTSGASDTTDQWLIDNLTIDRLMQNPVAPFVDTFEGGVISGTIWDEIDNAQVVVSASTHAASLQGESMIESIDIPMAQFGITPGYVRVDAWTQGAGVDDSVVVEVLNTVNSWEAIGTLNGADLGTSPETFQFQTPLTAWAIDDLRVRLVSAGDDAILIDNVYVGPDALSDACSGADFAEPLGELDFFDVSAFLSAFGMNDLDADINNDGNFDFFDVSEFLTIYGQGCP